MPKAKRITAVNCPACSALCEVPDELEVDDVVSCDQCSADLVVIGVSPVEVVVADEEEDDDADVDEEDEEDGDEDDDLDDEDEDDEED